MFKKKKSQPAKEGMHQPTKGKKVPHLNLNPAPNVQESRIKTMPCIDLKQPLKSLQLQKELQKQYSNSKKNISRKTTSRTMRLDNSIRPSTLHVLLKQVKERKKTQICEGKSRSPRNRSKSGNKVKPSRSQQLKRLSQKRLSLKIGSTLRKLEHYEFVNDEDNNIVYPSASARPTHGGHVSSVAQIQGINLDEIKQFSSSQSVPSNRLKVQMKSGDSLQETIAAITIQRAWRSYTTKKLVSQYTKFFNFDDSLSNIEPSEQLAGLQTTLNQSCVVVPSEDFYADQAEDVQNISNLEESNDDSMEFKVKEVKMEQLEKWNSILLMIEATKDSSQEEMEALFKEIARQSEKNREELVMITQSRKSDKKSKKSSRRKKEDLEQPDNRVKLEQKKEEPFSLQLSPQSHLLSHQSEHLPLDSNIDHQHLQSQSDTNNYNSKKYIDHLDSDMYPQHERSNSSSSLAIRKAMGVTTISTKKQEMLLEALKARPSHLPRYGHETALSLTQINCSPRQVPHAARRQAKVNRCTSQKILKRTLSDLSELENNDVNLQMLEEEYLQMYPVLNEDHEEPIHDSHGPSNIRTMELQQENKMDNPEPPKIKIEQQEQDNFKQQLDDFLNTATSNNQNVIKIQENVDKNQKQLDDIIAAVLGSLAFEFFKDITVSDRITAAVKNFASCGRHKIKKADTNKKKRGFLTDKKQIQLFLHNLVNYVTNQEPTVLRNLQVPTGPSALEMLRYMHALDQDEQSDDSSSEEANIMVIPNRIFDSFWKIKEKSIVVEVPANFNEENSLAFKQNIEYLKSFNKIFYRALFDTFNQCLDWQRNFGILGRPFPWKTSPTFNHRISELQQRQCLQAARQKMINLSTTYCGLMVDSAELVSTAENEEYLQQVQEDRLSRMLASDLIESEHRWHFYDDEEAEILIQVSNVLYRELLFEALEHLLDFQ